MWCEVVAELSWGGPVRVRLCHCLSGWDGLAGDADRPRQVSRHTLGPEARELQSTAQHCTCSTRHRLHHASSQLSSADHRIIAFLLQMSRCHRLAR